jgi:hypothetical protein
MRLSCPPKSRTSVETSVRGCSVRLQAEGTKRVFARKSEEECNPINWPGYRHLVSSERVETPTFFHLHDFCVLSVVERMPMLL